MEKVYAYTHEYNVIIYFEFWDKRFPQEPAIARGIWKAKIGNR